jgi:hypothetical protein
MAQQPTKREANIGEGGQLEIVKQVEQETLSTSKSIKTFIFVVLGVLAYLTFFVMPEMNTRTVRIQKDLTSILLQSQRYERSARVFSAEHPCASCHLNPDYLLYGLMSRYKNLQELKDYLANEHQNYYTMTAPMEDERLMEIYRTLR